MVPPSATQQGLEDRWQVEVTAGAGEAHISHIDFFVELLLVAIRCRGKRFGDIGFDINLIIFLPFCRMYN